MEFAGVERERLCICLAVGEGGCAEPLLVWIYMLQKESYFMAAWLLCSHTVYPFASILETRCE